MKPLWRAIEALAWIAFFVFAIVALAAVRPDSAAFARRRRTAARRAPRRGRRLVRRRHETRGRRRAPLRRLAARAGGDRHQQRRDRVARREARRAAAGAFRAEPAPAKFWRPAFYRAHGASAGGAWLGRRIARPTGRPQRDRSRGLEWSALRPTRLHRPRCLARV